MEAQEGTQQPHLVLANKLFLLSHSDVPDIEKVQLREEVFASLKADDMAPLYETLVAESMLELDQGVMDSMRAKNQEELKKLDEKIADAEENLGESEEKALEQLKVMESRTVAVGQKMDLVFYTLQLGFFYMDFDLISKSIDKVKKYLFEEGGDWERKNCLKVYKGLYCMSTRNFKKAADLFLGSISTFTTYGIFSGLTEQIKLDRYLHPHFRYYMREIRTVVYSQFLESYKSVTIEAMAKAFGVTVDFIDLELSRFIAAGKLHCKIDKVAGVLETNRPDAKNSLYQATIKQGDFLLNRFRIQKLSRVIDL
ncbi:hypothetical protein DVH24_008578 [Malus domestica]|uniref:PCI domain-containing protein n=1 Tax=Malus domestica TaxID=3750 RepID=A0A498JK22_MALDO|nr:hypothetical protein DVH24_008578 [Malus domestica]